jgi:hypothetical protein
MKARSAGRLDLTAAVATIHTKHPEPHELTDEELAESLLLAAGDAPDRAAYFDYDPCRKPYEIDGRLVQLTLDPKARMHDYRDKKYRRRNRAQVTVPPKLRQNIKQLCGVEDGSEYLITTCLIALADYAAQRLLEEGGRLHVLPAVDHQAAERKAVRQKIKRAHRGW